MFIRIVCDYKATDSGSAWNQFVHVDASHHSQAGMQLLDTKYLLTNKDGESEAVVFE